MSERETLKGIFESHAHYDDRRFNEDREQIICSLFESGLDIIINVGADLPSSRASLDLASRYERIYATVGVHPHEAETMHNEDGSPKPEAYAQLHDMLKAPKVVALGECGLDFFYDHSPRDIQRVCFREQLDIAKHLNLPVIIHSRDAAQETFDIIKEAGIGNGVIHCYSGSAEHAEAYIGLGFYIGIGGVVTFDKSKRLPEVVKHIPLSHLVIETDAPYLSPTPNRGKRNDSANLVYIAQAIADIKGITRDEVIEITNANGRRLFYKTTVFDTMSM